MSKLQSSFSENEDDPDFYESSGDEWEEEEEKSKNKRRSSQRLSKKPKISHIESSDSEIDNPKPKSKNGINKKQKVTNVSNTNTVTPTPTKPNSNSGSGFMTGSFLILKKDAQSGDPLKHPCIWKIDGKALLQKFEPFEDEGKVKHRNTSIYTGWSALDKDLYAPINVQVLSHAGQKMVVELNWEQLKEVNDDSD